MLVKRLNNSSGWLWDFDGFRVLVDPWLQGKAVYFTPQIYEIDLPENVSIPLAEVGKVDLVLLSNYLSDHCHPATLAQINKDTPIIAPQKAMKNLLSLGFKNIKVLEDGVLGKPMVDFYGFRFGITKNVMFRDYLRAVMIHHVESGVRLFYAPHGSCWTAENAAQASEVDMKTWDIVITTCRYYKLPLIFGGIAQLGKVYAQSLVEQLKPRYFLNTHNFGFKGTGLIAHFPGEELIEKAADLHVDSTCKLIDLALGEEISLG